MVSERELSNLRALSRLTPIILSASLVSILFLSAALIGNVAAPHTAQPGTEHSKLIAFDDLEISDTELAGWITANVPDNDYKNLIFVFGQCFGGGFIDELLRSNVVVMSAARHDKSSISVLGGQSRFLKPLADALDVTTPPTIKSAFDTAKANDIRASLELPQYHSQGTGADNIKLGETTKKSAILFVGKKTGGGGDPNPVRKDYWNDINRIHSVLVSRYGFAENDIYALFWDKKDPDGNVVAWADSSSNKNDLKSAIENWLKTRIDQTPDVADEQVFFWAHDHGSRSHPVCEGILDAEGVVGGVVVPVDKLILLAPYIGLASIIAVAAVATVHLRRVTQKQQT